MKKIYLKLSAVMIAAVFGGSSLSAQTGCAYSQTTNLHSYGCFDGDAFDTYTLNGIAANNYGCSTNNYSLFTSPVWNLTIGNSYTFGCTVGGQWQYDQGIAIWIDLNNDGSFSSTEQVFNSNNVNGPATFHTGTINIPATATPGSNVRMRLRCDYYGYLTNHNSSACQGYGAPDYEYYMGETEDYYVNLISPVPCTTTPSANSVVTPTHAFCPGESAYVTLSNSYTVGDITYQWLSSTTSSVGPFTPVPTGTNGSLQTPTLSSNVWYQAVITCSNTGGSVTATPAQVLVQGVTIQSVPYHEGFEGIVSDNKLPNCSWLAPNIGSTQLTYMTSNTNGRFPHSGQKFASYYYSPAGVNTFYTNGIQLEANVTYSVGLWWQTDYYGYNNWTDLSILLGQQQSSTGQTTLASTNGAAVSNTYKLLSNTFSVSSSGVYYLGIRATSTSGAYAYYLSWDDLFITIPCELNSPALSVTPSQTVCAEDDVHITASGADVFQWAHGPTTGAIVEKPMSSVVYSVTGTNTITGCSASQIHFVTVNPRPDVGIFTSKFALCPGESVLLTAFGADTYNWTTNDQTQTTKVTPQSTTTYSVEGKNAFDCVGSAAVTISVHPAANISAAPDRDPICVGETVELQADGGLSYEFVSQSSHNTANPAVVKPSASTNYTVIGTDANGCKGVQVVGITVEACTGLSEMNSSNGVKVFPNPNRGEFMVSARGNAVVTITDLTGRHVASFEGSDNVSIDISDLANGVYYVKVLTQEGSDVVRIVKD